ncbi:MAG: TldD/PmbA family protein [Bacillota bacterium]|jgi:PmbA protein|nr:TldD/PmbA family protein [Bacillota bacterium]
MDVQEFKNKVFALGQASGLEEMEIYFSRSKSFSTRIFEKEVDSYNVSSAQGVGFRARFAGKVGYAYAETLDQESVELLVAGAKANAQIIDSDDEIEFYAGSPSYPETVSYNPSLEDVSAEEKIDFARELEAQAFAADNRVYMVNWAAAGHSETEVYIANTEGLEKSFSRNGAYGVVAALVREDGQVKSGRRIVYGNDWSKFDAKQLAQEAVEEAVSLLGASSVPSGDCRILLRHDAAYNLLETFASVFSAESVQKGLSLLDGKLGQEIASPKVTLVDDPLLENGGASAAFDGEGVATRTKDVIEKGRLVTFLHNLKTAKKDGVEPTGNASRASFKSPVGISPTNFFIQPGEKSYDQLVADLSDGIIIIDVQGLHSGANPVSGDFSLGAYGYLVEKGKVVRPVDQITIAGNFFKLLAAVEEVGSDLQFGTPGPRGHIGSPSLLISSLSVAGI